MNTETLGFFYLNLLTGKNKILHRRHDPITLEEICALRVLLVFIKLKLYITTCDGRDSGCILLLLLRLPNSLAYLNGINWTTCATWVPIKKYSHSELSFTLIESLFTAIQ